NQRDGFERVLSHAHPRLARGAARRIGITGPPGAGKSTLTERLIQQYRGQGLSVGVVAVDPTSPFTGGALLGDRIRMESASLDPHVFIRSMATRGAHGGLATTTEEVADLLEAFGFARILVETVGVGQTELDIARSTETTLLVLVPESGDGIQTLKAGVMEIADVYVVNKSDRPGADTLRQEVEVMLGIRRGNACGAGAGGAALAGGSHPGGRAARPAARRGGRGPPQPVRRRGGDPGSTEGGSGPMSGNSRKPMYTAADLSGFDPRERLGAPGEFPFTRGIHPTMYRGRLWTMRQFAGFGSAEDTNQRYHFLLEHGQTGLSVAFDFPTLMGYDSDHPRAEG